MRTHKWHLRSYCLQTKLVLTVTALLILLPTLFFLFYEFRLPQWQSLTPGEKVLGALFQSVTPRTAGFNTVDLMSLTEGSTLLTMILMFVGAGSGSTGGGIKVNTFAVLLLAMLAQVWRREDVDVFRRRLDAETLHKAYSSVCMYTLACLTGCMILCVQGIALEDALYEAVSAIGTVGLTRGVTPVLPEISKAAVLLLMFIGRVGSMSVAMAMTRDRPTPRVRNIPEKILIG